MAIRTPDQRLRVFVSSTLGELAAERRAVSRAIAALRLTPVLFELGYLAFSVPALIAGVATTKFGLHATALVYSASLAALVAVAVANLVFRPRGQPAQSGSASPAVMPPGPGTGPPAVVTGVSAGVALVSWAGAAVPGDRQRPRCAVDARGVLSGGRCPRLRLRAPDRVAFPAADGLARRGERGKNGDTPATIVGVDVRPRALARSARRAPAEQVPAARPAERGDGQFAGRGQLRYISDCDTTARSEKRISL